MTYRIILLSSIPSLLIMWTTGCYSSSGLNRDAKDDTNSSPEKQVDTADSNSTSDSDIEETEQDETEEDTDTFYFQECSECEPGLICESCTFGGHGLDMTCSSCFNACLHNDCCDTLETCHANDGCWSLYGCYETNCCNSENADNCGSKEEMAGCFNECVSSLGVDDDAISAYTEMLECVVCNACPLACDVPISTYPIYCNGDEVNTPLSPCYPYQAEEDETACFSWAGLGGPCTSQTSLCKSDETCVSLETCINDSWSSEDWESIQIQCFENAEKDAETLYWAYMQCIYCDACDVACAADAPSKNCSEYLP